ncbi:MAG: pentapeptide repeat-containing protein [Leptolyngbya sp. UWPOB_LEPTO1]|uniref:pentapeptide repeat-containing protein n=1 Tax=Leptolyngbya sp. UWPOB_LEPTO1 TaxID=2815653 RepID=UPI001AC0854E|nr:pentapeptide repeat-containing protein [Leptolyngbya sp. UWPOB_LEPTO1]MBN8564244.1 pentapeptide repeat-containing protein [Leptolyngbya sp. UWPOB_LEPTO1]
MTQPTPPESSNNHRSDAKSPSFVKRGKLWVPDTFQSRRSLLQKVWHWTGFGEKKLWDVLQLLIVPTALAIGAFYLQETSKQRDLELADDRAKQEMLNRYFDQISTLLFDRGLRTAKADDESRIVAQARTLTALRELDGERQGQLIKFLHKAKLLQAKKPVLDLRQTNLREANLSGSNLSDIDLAGVDLAGINLSDLNLPDTDSILSVERKIGNKEPSRVMIFRSYENLSRLERTNLEGANLSGTDFRAANLRRVNLSRTDLSKADLSKADLRDTNLSFANLKDAIMFEPILDGTLLCNTIMPDGTKSDRDCDKLKHLK